MSRVKLSYLVDTIGLNAKLSTESFLIIGNTSMSFHFLNMIMPDCGLGRGDKAQQHCIHSRKGLWEPFTSNVESCDMEGILTGKLDLVVKALFVMKAICCESFVFVEALRFLSFCKKVNRARMGCISPVGLPRRVT